MTDVSKSKKVATTTSTLTKTQPKKTIHYWRYSEPSYTKNNFNYLRKKKVLYIEKSKPKFKIFKV